MKQISQQEARRLQKRVAHLEAVLDAQRASWASEFPGGVHIGNEVDVSVEMTTAIKTARRLGHAVVALQANRSEIMFYALPLPKSEHA